MLHLSNWLANNNQEETGKKDESIKFEQIGEAEY